MKKYQFALAAALAFGLWSGPTFGQYQAAPSYAPTNRAAPVATASPYAVQRSAGRPQFTASRPTAYGAPTMNPPVPTATFRPVNPPSSTTQRVLTASKMPTPAPTPAMNASQPMPQAAAAAPQSMWQPSMNGQDWSAPMPSMHGGYAGGYAGGNATPAMDYSYGGGAPYAGGCDTCGTGCGVRRCGLGGCGLGCCCLSGHTCCIAWRTTGDLVQHMPFFGTTHGYYYFRPYHVMHVFSQQELATRWGGDARNPYDNNALFQRIYDQMGVNAPLPTTQQSTVNPVPMNAAPIVNDYIVPQGSGGVPNYQGPTSGLPGANSYRPSPTPVPMNPPVAPGTEYVPMPTR